MAFILKQAGGNVKVIDSNGENLGYFDRSQIICNYNGLDNTVSITMIAQQVITLAPVTGGGVLTIDTVAGGTVDITSQALFDTNYALLFPKLGSGSTTLEAGTYNPVASDAVSCVPLNAAPGIDAPKGFYHKIGKIVNVSVFIVVDVTPFATASFVLTLPPVGVPVMPDSQYMAGVATQSPDTIYGGIPSCGIVQGVAGQEKVIASIYSTFGDNFVWCLNFSYEVA